MFSAIGIYNHGLPNFSMDRLRKADSFMAGWFECMLPWWLWRGWARSQWSIQSRHCCRQILGWDFDYMCCNIRSYSSIYLCLSNNGKHFRFAYWLENIIDNIFPMKQRRRMMYINMAARLNSFELLTSLVWRW